MSDLLSSGVFWTAVGSVAGIVAAVAGVVALLRRSETGILAPDRGGDEHEGRAKRAGPVAVEMPSTEEVERQQEQVNEAARQFDFWMKNYTHHGEMSDTQRLLDWLEADRGVRTVAGSYAVFRSMAERLAELGYSTVPAPTQVEFSDRVAAARRHQSLEQ